MDIKATAKRFNQGRGRGQTPKHCRKGGGGGRRKREPFRDKEGGGVLPKRQTMGYDKRKRTKESEKCKGKGRKRGSAVAKKGGSMICFLCETGRELGRELLCNSTKTHKREKRFQKRKISLGFINTRERGRGDR